LSTWSLNNRLPALATLALALMAAAIALIFFYAPLDEDGLNQKIFYFHVPIAFTGLRVLRLGWLEGAPPL
jgi:ABC-type transport system involved in cytochrome c biogenesis permease subunit